MLLALDVGNTHVVVGLMEGRQVRRSFRIATRRDNAVGDYAVALSQLLELAEVDRQEVEQVIISSVVPPVTRALQGAARLLTGKEPLVVGGNVRCRVPVRIKRPETLGADQTYKASARQMKILYQSRWYYNVKYNKIGKIKEM